MAAAVLVPTGTHFTYSHHLLHRRRRRRRTGHLESRRRRRSLNSWLLPKAEKMQYSNFELHTPYLYMAVCVLYFAVLFSNSILKVTEFSTKFSTAALNLVHY